MSSLSGPQTTETAGDLANFGSSQQDESRFKELGPILCLVPGCGYDLSNESAYHRRHRVCLAHLRAEHVVLEGSRCRFCQQCGRFQPLCDFKDQRRSCEAALRAHNARRRIKKDAGSSSWRDKKPRPSIKRGSVSSNTGQDSLSSSSGGTPAAAAGNGLARSLSGRRTSSQRSAPAFLQSMQPATPDADLAAAASATLVVPDCTARSTRSHGDHPAGLQQESAGLSDSPHGSYTSLPPLQLTQQQAQKLQPQFSHHFGGSTRPSCNPVVAQLDAQQLLQRSQQIRAAGESAIISPVGRQAGAVAAAEGGLSASCANISMCLPQQGRSRLGQQSAKGFADDANTSPAAATGFRPQLVLPGSSSLGPGAWSIHMQPGSLAEWASTHDRVQQQHMQLQAQLESCWGEVHGVAAAPKESQPQQPAVKVEWNAQQQEQEQAALQQQQQQPAQQDAWLGVSSSLLNGQAIAAVSAAPTAGTAVAMGVGVHSFPAAAPAASSSYQLPKHAVPAPAGLGQGSAGVQVSRRVAGPAALPPGQHAWPAVGTAADTAPQQQQQQQHPSVAGAAAPAIQPDAEAAAGAISGGTAADTSLGPAAAAAAAEAQAVPRPDSALLREPLLGFKMGRCSSTSLGLLDALDAAAPADTAAADDETDAYLDRALDALLQADPDWQLASANCHHHEADLAAAPAPAAPAPASAAAGGGGGGGLGGVVGMGDSPATPHGTTVGDNSTQLMPCWPNTAAATAATQEMQPWPNTTTVVPCWQHMPQTASDMDVVMSSGLTIAAPAAHVGDMFCAGSSGDCGGWGGGAGGSSEPIAMLPQACSSFSTGTTVSNPQLLDTQQHPAAFLPHQHTDLLLQQQQQQQQVYPGLPTQVMQQSQQQGFHPLQQQPLQDQSCAPAAMVDPSGCSHQHYQGFEGGAHHSSAADANQLAHQRLLKLSVKLHGVTPEQLPSSVVSAMQRLLEHHAHRMDAVMTQPAFRQGCVQMEFDILVRCSPDASRRPQQQDEEQATDALRCKHTLQDAVLGDGKERVAEDALCCTSQQIDAGTAAAEAQLRQALSFPVLLRALQGLPILTAPAGEEEHPNSSSSSTTDGTRAPGPAADTVGSRLRAVYAQIGGFVGVWRAAQGSKQVQDWQPCWTHLQQQGPCTPNTSAAPSRVVCRSDSSSSSTCSTGPCTPPQLSAALACMIVAPAAAGVPQHAAVTAGAPQLRPLQLRIRLQAGMPSVSSPVQQLQTSSTSRCCSGRVQLWCHRRGVFLPCVSRPSQQHPPADLAGTSAAAGPGGCGSTSELAVCVGLPDTKAGLLLLQAEQHVCCQLHSSCSSDSNPSAGATSAQVHQHEQQQQQLKAEAAAAAPVRCKDSLSLMSRVLPVLVCPCADMAQEVQLHLQGVDHRHRMQLLLHLGLLLDYWATQQQQQQGELESRCDQQSKWCQGLLRHAPYLSAIRDMSTSWLRVACQHGMRATAECLQAILQTLCPAGLSAQPCFSTAQQAAGNSTGTTASAFCMMDAATDAVASRLHSSSSSINCQPGDKVSNSHMRGHLKGCFEQPPRVLVGCKDVLAGAAVLMGHNDVAAGRRFWGAVSAQSGDELKQCCRRQEGLLMDQALLTWLPLVAV